MNSNTSKLRYNTVHSDITNHWEYFKMEKDKKIKVSEIVNNFPEEYGCFRKQNQDAVVLDSSSVSFEELETLTDYVLAVEFDLPFYFYYEDDSFCLKVVVEKDNGSDEHFVLAQNIFGIKFVNCKFNHQFSLRNNLKLLHFENCVFEKRCYVNNQYSKNTKSISIEKIFIKKTTFNQNFKLHNVEIKKFHIEDSDFLKNADFYKSHFKNGFDDKQISFHAINFHELALFGEAVFDEFLQFKYVTFRGYTHFRATTFNNGLDLEYANIEKEMNFFAIKNLDNKKSKEKTSQETYRIVKYQLEKVGNIIDANKYAALELDKHRIYVWSRNNVNFELLSDGIVSFLHFISSNNSRYWFVALLWIVIVSFVTVVMLEKDYHDINLISQYSSILNGFDEFKVNFERDYFVMLFNKVALGYLYYQFLTAIRKNTRK
jgi:hypothetical protein